MLSIDGHAAQGPNPFSSAQLSRAFAIAGTHLPMIAIYEIRDSDNRKSTVTRHFVRRLSITASILLSCVQKALSGPAHNLNGLQNTNYRTESFRSPRLRLQLNLISTGVDVWYKICFKGVWTAFGNVPCFDVSTGTEPCKRLFRTSSSSSLIIIVARRLSTFLTSFPPKDVTNLTEEVEEEFSETDSCFVCDVPSVLLTTLS